MSTLLRGLKQFPVDITAIVSVCDDGRSTGRLRQEFNTIAVGDIRRVIVALSEVEPLVEKLFNYRFHTTSDLDGHTVGNLLLTAMSNINGNLSEGIEALAKILNLKGRVLPLTEDNVVLMADMEDGRTIEGEHNITETHGVIKKVYYKEEPVVSSEVIRSIKEADLILLSMGSLYTSIIPNLLEPNVVEALKKSKAKKMYVCNAMTEHGETDGFYVSDCVKQINKYVSDNFIDVVIANSKLIDKSIQELYLEEQSTPILIDEEEISKMGIELIKEDLATIVNNQVRHDPVKTALAIFTYITKDK